MHRAHLHLPTKRPDVHLGYYATPGDTSSPVLNQDNTRTPFERDYDRVVFSKNFRRLADKTQVVPLPEDAHTHNRLLHSLEVATVGRSIVSTLVSHDVLDPSQEKDLTRVVETACLAHDIGNPPFGHHGEHTLREWWKNFSSTLLLDGNRFHDFENFDGNAMGFATIVELGLTHATMLAYSKYTVSARHIDISADPPVFEKKSGLLEFNEIHLNHAMCDSRARFPDTIPSGRRHPLAYIVEAADDICNFVMDAEDCLRQGFITEASAKEIMKKAVAAMHLEAQKCDPPGNSFIMKRLNELARNMPDTSARIESIRSFVMHYGVLFASHAFSASSAQILETWNRPTPLITCLPKDYEEIYFRNPKVLAVLLRGSRALEALMQNFVLAALATHPIDESEVPVALKEAIRSRGASRNRSTYGLLSETTRKRLVQARPGSFRDWIEETVKAVAFFVFGMTDSYALKTAECFD